MRGILTAVVLGTALLLPAAPATAAHSGDADPTDTDYEQVVDITFPLAEHTAVTYRDDYDDGRGSGRHHQATDLMVPLGTPVHAAMGGTVRWMSGDRATGAAAYGWTVRIAGDDGRSYAYVHLGEQDGPWDKAYAEGIEPGARVDRGQLLGWAGCSGSATCGGGEHLHFEIHDQHVVDPYDHHDHERINPYRSLVAAEQRGDYPTGSQAGVSPPEVLFRDVDPHSLHADDIAALARSGITRGCGANDFCPGDRVSRQQMASFLTRALELPLPDTPHGFSDVAASNVHGADIAALARAGITRGCGGEGYCPGEGVTRQQMASFLVRALELDPAPPAAFSDVAADNVHAEDIAALAAAGITLGCGGDRFCPEDVVTREQMASFLVRALGL